ncbi:hypothetical protein F892_00168 [Acinetobacter vivianii]|uniref:Uncharacterized protein n=1 Tax=Acinetobacter vivianii TaxID=1776742 RepID=N9NR99_9GAMM|nr:MULTISPECIES: hypothetical protein [Acinetobacter]ENX23573.1 hypothetical protein F892_00168 [Acinetobacter vivianii]OEC90034.1 hypothetical protein A9Z07_05220 [Acinetobacter sp. YK3]GGI62058.1 hypothetical protein GCM10011446_35530 [Acinetobacter vivianii]
MNLGRELQVLDQWIEDFPKIGMETLGGEGGPMYILDIVVIGVTKRSLSLATGLRDLVNAKNMTCSRAIVRMQLDTVSRFLAYTYVDDPSGMALAVIGGKPLHKFKCRDGKQLRDGYLIERMSEKHPWVKNTYKYTSGYVHFSEKQVFDSIQSFGNDEERTVQFQVSSEDHKFPEASWVEIVQCFNEMLSIVAQLFATYKNELKWAGR